MAARILVVDDDPSVLRMLVRTLGAEGNEVEAAADGGAALLAVERRAPDAVVLDVAMPGMDGLAVCRRLRDRGLTAPVLLLTARDAVADRVAGLEAGADDYLVKPFAVEELLARLAAIARRGQGSSGAIAVGSLRLDPVRRAVSHDGLETELTDRESALLELLMRHPRNVVTREHALDELWGASAVENVVDRCVMSLRRKLGDADLIRTVRGVGFVLGPVRMRSLRLRIALAAALGVFVAVAALGGAAEYIVRHELRASQDRGLRGRAVDVARLSVSAPALLTSPGALDAPYGGQDLLVEVVDRQGRIVARSSALGGRLLGAGQPLRDAIVHGRGSYGQTSLAGTPLRVFVAPLPDAARLAGGGAVIVASSEREIEDTADDVRTLLLLCGLAAAVVGALAAAALTGRGLAPLRRLTAAARAIERAGDPARRLPPARTEGEVAELTETLNRMLTALEAAQRSERRFLADASHELRTPVTALRGNVEYLARHGADPETVADLQDDAARLARLVDDLLVLERQGQVAPARGPVALDGLARASAADATGDVEVRIDAGGPVLVEGDEDSLRRAVDNLVANAFVHGRPPVRIIVTRERGDVRLAVVDGGPGLSAADAEAAFERFWRSPDSRSRPGTGLGLAIVWAVAAAHGGRAEADGATFSIVLPALPPGAENVRERSETPSSVADVPIPR